MAFRLTRVAAVVVLLALLLPSLVTVSAAQETAGDNVLRVRMPWWPDTLDPQKTSYVEEIAVSTVDYEGLTRLDENLQTVRLRPSRESSTRMGRC